MQTDGWSGTAAQLRADAVVFCQAGFLVVTFDYRGWGESDRRAILDLTAAGVAPRRSLPSRCWSCARSSIRSPWRRTACRQRGAVRPRKLALVQQAVEGVTRGIARESDAGEFPCGA
jgi:hypothetical protein